MFFQLFIFSQGLIPVAGASVLAAAYIGLRELAGPCVALAMPILVGCFEFLGRNVF